MIFKKKQFSSKYGKSYKSIQNAEKAVNKFLEETFKSSDFEKIGTVSWIPTICEDDPSRIKPVFINVFQKGLQPIWFVEAGFAVIG